MNTLSFAVRRHEPVLVAPARPTPRGTKRLSDIDCTEWPPCYVPAVFIYRGGGGGQAARSDPVAVIRRALSEALVHYYPLAGRIREVVVGERGLVVDCTGDGVLFAEAAGLRLPFPCNMDQLQLGVDRGRRTPRRPLFMIQVMFWETFLVSVKSSSPSGEDEDDDEVAVPVALPRPAMDRFVEEMNKLLKA
ncbi:benzyl alcohol O-benzoyltransferase-like [Hordeum vulgare]|nr:benzyl alcohol O-benzoyltransferase-like [Hordeum vulgare]